jgi:hypothetical protein
MIQIDGMYRGKILNFKDSYALITTKLRNFVDMFKLPCGDKETLPYEYSHSTTLAKGNKIGVVKDPCEYFREDEVESFMDNLKKTSCLIKSDRFWMDLYSNHYCMQNVRILKDGMEYFRESLFRAFGLDVYEFVSISNIANRIMEECVYWPNGNLDDLANKPREFISKCIHCGRCLQNQKFCSTAGSAAVVTKL